jgi:hypothetical protein
VNSLVHRHRQPLVWLCIAAALLLGVGSMLHGLSHSVQAVQASHKDGLAAHVQTCEQCLQYAALDGAAPIVAAETLPAPFGAAAPDAAATPPMCASAFTAYASRAPPPLV